MFHTPPRGRTRYFQMNTIAPPEIIPASAPCQFERLQKRANNTTGPNTAPKPAHAKETMPNTELFGSRAIKAAITAMANKVKRAAFIAFFLVSRFGNSVAEKVGRYGGGCSQKL